MFQFRSLSALVLSASLVGTVPAMAKDIVVGAGLSLTGSYAFVGVPQANGMKLATDEINEKKLLGEGNKIVLHIYDDGNERGQALTVAQKAVIQDKAVAYFAPASAPVAVAVGGAMNDLAVPAFSLASSLIPIQTTKWWFKINAASDGLATPIANYAADKAKVRKVAIFHLHDHESHVAQSNKFKEILQSKGAEIVAEATAAMRDTDFMAAATKIAQANPDGVYIGAGGEQAANVIIQLRQAGIGPDTKFFGTGGLGGDFAKHGASAVNNTYATADYNYMRTDKLNQDFLAAYQKRFNTLPDNFAAIGYDAMYFLADAIKRALPDATPERIRAEFAKIKDHPSVMGTGTWGIGEDRLPIYDMNIMVAKDGKFVTAP